MTSRKWCGVILTSFWRHPVWNTCTRTHLLYQGAIQLPWGQNRHPEAKTVTLRARPSPSGQNRHPQGKTVTLGDFSIGLHWGTYPSVPPKFFFHFFCFFFLFWSIWLPCMMLWCHSDVTQMSAILEIHMLEWKYMCKTTPYCTLHFLYIIGVTNMYPSWHVTIVTWRHSDVRHLGKYMC